MRTLRIGIGILCMVFGVFFFLTPEIKTHIAREAYRAIRTAESADSGTGSGRIREAAEAGEMETVSGESEDETSGENGQQASADDPYAYMDAYNRKLSEEGQEITDAWIYEQNPVSSRPEAIGTIRIPDMDVELPLFIGATYEHLDQGAAVLGGTSMPVGGIDTNCVISGHRSWCGAPYFRDIDVLHDGSLVEVDNGRDTLSYRVFETKIILPDETEAILIQPGKDLVTLVTCHPYLGGGTHRYVVYCERWEGAEAEDLRAVDCSGGKELMENKKEAEKRPEVVGAAEEDDPEDQRSELVQLERRIRQVCIWVAAAAVAAMIVRRRRH